MVRLQNAMYGQRDAGFFGYSHFTGGFAGGQAEFVRVPKGNVNLLPIPDKVPDEMALYLSDILPTSYHAVHDTGVQKGDVVGIWVGHSYFQTILLPMLMLSIFFLLGLGSHRSFSRQVVSAERRLTRHWNRQSSREACHRARETRNRDYQFY